MTRAHSAGTSRWGRSALKAVGVVGVLGLLAGACGDDDDAETTDTTVATTATTAGTSEATSEAGAADPEWEATVEAAKEEGKVVLYLALASFEARVEEGFEEAYPEIDLQILREGTGPLITKLEQERDQGVDGGDVAFHSSRAWMEENKAEFTAPAGPAVELWQDGDQWYDSYFTSLFLAFNIAFNPGVVESAGAQPITTWEDLLQPQLKGLLGLTRPDVSPVYLQHFWFLNEELGDDFTDQLAAQEPRLYDSAGPLSQAVAAGELAAGVNLTPVQSGVLIDEGAPLESVTTAEPQYAIGYWAAQVGWSKRPAAAAVLMDWLMSEEGQQSMSDWGYSSSPLPQITDDFELEEGIDIYDGILTPEQEAFQERFNGLFL